MEWLGVGDIEGRFEHTGGYLQLTAPGEPLFHEIILTTSAVSSTNLRSILIFAKLRTMSIARL